MNFGFTSNLIMFFFSLKGMPGGLNDSVDDKEIYYTRKGSI